MLKWNPILGEFLITRLEPENEKIKIRCCGWTFTKKKN